MSNNRSESELAELESKPKVMAPEDGARRLKIYTTPWCGHCRMAKAVLDGAGLDYQEIDIDHDPSAVATVLAINGGYRTVPTILLPSGQVLVEPSRKELLEALGLENLRHA